MIRHSSLGWGLNRPSALPPRFNRGPSGQEYTTWAPVRPVLTQCSRIRLEHGQTWSRPAQGSNMKLESLLEAEAPGLQDFFNRQHELQCHTGLLSTMPCAITVIVGPASPGKTALVEHYIEQLDLDRKALPVYIDCREVDVQTPDSFADALLHIVSSRIERLPAFAGAFLTALANNNLSNKVRLVDLESLPAMSEILAALITKQQNTAHVLLLTSDYAFIDWLQQGIRNTFYEDQVVGDFPAEEARKFFEMLKRRACNDDDWQKVYEVCGGNAGLLNRAALRSTRGSLAQALEDIKTTAMAKLISGLWPLPSDGWTQAQYATAVRSILAAPANVVSAGTLKAQFGVEGAGKEVLQAMVRANLLAYRPASSWARDMERSAFGKDRAVITAPTPANLACMRKVELPQAAPSAGTVSSCTGNNNAMRLVLSVLT
ncbi:g1459 [Coccomyxa elongata]